jgi:hypothetical protein
LVFDKCFNALVIPKENLVELRGGKFKLVDSMLVEGVFDAVPGAVLDAVPGSSICIYKGKCHNIMRFSQNIECWRGVLHRAEYL